MEIRFTLDSKFDAGLIARIKRKSNGSSNNRGAKLLMRHWYEIEVSEQLTSTQRATDSQSSEPRAGGDELETALGQIDEAW